MSSVVSVVPNDREQTILSQLNQVELLAKQIHRRCKLCTIPEYCIRGAIVDYLRQVDPLARLVRQFKKRRDAASAKMED